MQSYMLKVAAVGVLALSMAGCKSAPEKAADKNLSDMKSANSDTASTSIGAKNLPAACDSYITKVDSCVKKLGANNPMAGSFKTAMETTRSNWASIQDKEQLANACKQADDMFSKNAAAMGCGQ